MEKLSTKLMAVAALTLGLSSTAQAVKCGDTIGPRETVKLEQDLVCPAGFGSVALWLEGPATLDMNGYTIKCEEPASQFSRGIVVFGKNAKLKDGTVFRCHTGVALQGEGRHRVENVRAMGVEKYGFKVESPRNTLKENVTLDVGGPGFHVLSDRNKLQDNVVMLGAKMGYVVEQASKNTLTRNFAGGSDGAGFTLLGGQENKLLRNRAIRNGAIGIAVLSGEKHQVMRNTAERNEEYGIGVNASVSGAKIMSNTSTGNTSFDMFQSGDCGDNKWARNDFDTWNRDCID